MYMKSIVDTGVIPNVTITGSDPPRVSREYEALISLSVNVRSLCIHAFVLPH